MTEQYSSLFRIEGERFVPTPAAGSPWGRLVGGGPVSALLGRAVEALIEDPALMVARLTLDLFRPVPQAPLEVVAAIVRPGRRLQLAQATLIADGAPVASATAQILATRPTDHATRDETVPAFAGPGELEDSPLLDADTQLFERQWGFHDVVGVRWVRRPGAGSSVAWMRLPVALVEGEQPSPLVRVAAVCDYLSALCGTGAETIPVPYINTDLTVYMHRPLSGEWLGMEVEREIGPNGLGVARAKLFDREGPVGAASEAVLMNPR